MTTWLDRGEGTIDDPWYPIDVQLTSLDSNTGTLMDVVAAALKQHGVSQLAINQFREEVLSSDGYQMALRTMMRWVNVS